MICVTSLSPSAREALEALDRQGWQRSFHQRLFHDNFIRACARIFWKTEPPGAFARDHQKILEMNGWDHLSQEILVSTPRRYLLSHTSLAFFYFFGNSTGFCDRMARHTKSSKQLLLCLRHDFAAFITLSFAISTNVDFA